MCGRCGQVWHVVMAKMGDRIAKVVCKRCGGHHRYRDENADATAAAGRATRRRVRGGPRSDRRGERRVGARRGGAAVPPFDPAKPPRTYAARDSYVAGERVAHPTFGVGVVAGVARRGQGRGRVSGAGARVLACAKETSTLARPVAMQDLPLPDRPPK